MAHALEMVNFNGGVFLKIRLAGASHTFNKSLDLFGSLLLFA
jgi:hypothetical protein